MTAEDAGPSWEGLQLNGNILITGGSGFLGKAILLAAEREGWEASFTVYSRDEAKQARLRRRFPGVRFLLGDVRDYDALEMAVAGHETVIHAAAMKHIPRSEIQPSECVAVNVTGSENVLLACWRQNVRKVVGISTDKAVYPINAYGLSKAVMEKLFVEYSRRGLDAVCVRYGNVAGSTESVIPLFQEQAKSGTVKITNPDMTRFWFGPWEAVALIVEAISLPSGSILVPKMGAMSLMNLADCVAPGAGKEIVGHRPGEKVHEMLLNPQEAAHIKEQKASYLIHPLNGQYPAPLGFMGYTSQFPEYWVDTGRMRSWIADAEMVTA